MAKSDLTWSEFIWQQNLIWADGKLFIALYNPLSVNIIWIYWLWNIVPIGSTFQIWKIQPSEAYLIRDCRAILVRIDSIEEISICGSARQDLLSKDVSFSNYKHPEPISSLDPKNVKLVSSMTFIITKSVFPPTCSSCCNFQGAVILVWEHTLNYNNSTPSTCCMVLPSPISLHIHTNTS